MALHNDGSISDRGETVCVIGAGAAGLAAIKNLREHGFAVDCYERDTGVGGGWNWRQDRSPVYASAHLVTSRSSSEYPDFPMPDSWPDYPHHSQMLFYLQRYADHFELREHIWFGTEVVRVDPAPGERWDVTTRSTGRGDGERTTRYAAVVVANGHHWAPAMPEYEGMARYSGTVLHSSTYKDPAQLRGRRVLVIGGGNSGCDIAVEAAHQATTVWHSTRRGYWYLPKYLVGRPVDQLNSLALAARLPSRVRQWLFRWLLRLSVGDPTRFGLRRPDHRVYETHPVVDGRLLYAIGHGTVTPVPDVARFHRAAVELTDGRVIEPDVVVLATGYLPRFEFLAPEVIDADERGRPRLGLHAFPRSHPTLAVVGLAQPESGTLTLVHWQAVAVARWLRLRETRPELAGRVRAAMVADAHRAPAGSGGPESPRRWFEVGQVDYLRSLQRILDELAVA